VSIRAITLDLDDTLWHGTVDDLEGLERWPAHH
jgi:predicted enzyme involved in methoxymalonyl-ACP biosynthesis